MQTLKATASVFHDKRRVKKDGAYPVKITVYFDGEKRRYQTGVDLSENEWEKISGTNLRDDDLKQKKRKIDLKKKAIEDVLDKVNPFSFSDFEAFFFEEKKLRRSSYIQSLFDEYIVMLEKEERIGTLMSYRTTINSLTAFRGNKKISEINTSFLKEYEKHLTLEGKSPSTIGIYMRQLRRIFNYSIENGVLPAHKYPFKGYVIPNSRNIKKALTAAQVKSLFAFKTEDPLMRKALDFWLFSYLCNGINMADICYLKKTNVQGEFFSFFRAKTKNTKKRDLRPIKVPLIEESIAVINTWGNRNPDNPYLFPILEEGLTAWQIKYRIQDFIKTVNENMKKVAEKLEITVGVGTYVARHTHSTVLKRAGVSTEVIKENLGHSSVITTENYLDDFTDEVKQNFAKMLIDL